MTVTCIILDAGDIVLALLINPWIEGACSYETAIRQEISTKAWWKLENF